MLKGNKTWTEVVMGGKRMSRGFSALAAVCNTGKVKADTEVSNLCIILWKYKQEMLDRKKADSSFE